MTNWGRILKQCRKEKGISQEQLAEEIGVSARTVGCWETGGRGMTIKHATAAFAYLGYDFDLQLRRNDERLEES